MIIIILNFKMGQKLRKQVSGAFGVGTMTKPNDPYFQEKDSALSLD